MDRSIELDELVEHWTLLDDEQELVAGKRGATRLAFVALLKFYGQHGRFPRGRAELPGAAVQFIADQVKVSASELGLYEWSGRTRVTVMVLLGMRVTGWRSCAMPPHRARGFVGAGAGRPRSGWEDGASGRTCLRWVIRRWNPAGRGLRLQTVTWRSVVLEQAAWL